LGGEISKGINLDLPRPNDEDILAITFLKSFSSQYNSLFSISLFCYTNRNGKSNGSLPILAKVGAGPLPLLL